MNTRFSSFVFFILIFATSLDSYADEFDISIQDYASIPAKSMFAMSPSGDMVGYRTVQGDQDAYVVVDLGSNKMVAGINIAAIDPENAYFINETQLIFVASKYTSLYGYEGKHHISTAYVYDLASKKIRQLVIPGKGVYDGQTQFGNIIGISSDNEFAYMPMYVKRGSYQAMYSVTKVSLTAKRTPKTISLGTIDTVDFFMGDNGEVLARERYNNETNLHSVEKQVDGKWVQVFGETVPLRVRSFVGLTADKKSLVSISSYNDQDAYFTMSLDTGEFSEPLFATEDKSVKRAIKDINRVVYGVQFDGFKPSYGFFDKKQEQLLEGLQTAMPDNTFRLSNHNKDWSKLLFYVEGKGMSGNYFIYQQSGFSALTSARPQIPSKMVHPVVESSYQARDGMTIPVLLTYPKSKVSTKNNLPAIMLPHGGPEAYDKYGFDYWAQYFANKGMLVIQPQFRGSDGFGWKHRIAGRGKWGQEMQTDLTDGVNYLVEKGQVDPSRVCIVGASYGGYAALAGATFSPDVYKCVIAINGVSDLELMLEDEKFDAGDNHWVVTYWEQVMGAGEISDEFLSQISPINHAKKVTAPVLIIAGREDKVVPYYQSKNMYNALRKADKDVEYTLIRNVGHHFRHAEMREKLLTEIDKFIDKHL